MAPNLRRNVLSRAVKRLATATILAAIVLSWRAAAQQTSPEPVLPPATPTAQVNESPQQSDSAAVISTAPVLYDRYIKVKLPPDWVEKRSWELGDDRSLPLYNANLEAVAFIWGFDYPLYRPHYIQNLAETGRLRQRVEVDLSSWSNEASRYYAMVSGGFSVQSTAHTVTLGPTFKPSHVRFVGLIKIGRGQVELAEYVSDETVDAAFAARYKLRPELIGSKAQILMGQAVFPNKHGYAITACRFTANPDLDWLTSLLGNVELVPAAEKKQAADAELGRDVVSHAAAVAQERRYDHAWAQLDSELQLNLQDDNALMIEGEILLARSKALEAERLFRQAVAINPGNDRAHFALATALWDSNQRPEAIEELELVKKISPLYPKVDDLLQQRKSQLAVSTERHSQD